MSSVSNATSNQQYFQAVQTSSDAAKQDTAKADASKTAGTAPASPQQAAPAVAAKVVETASTRNSDGTFGPKHTIHPPTNYNNKAVLDSASADAVSTVNVKI